MIDWVRYFRGLQAREDQIVQTLRAAGIDRRVARRVARRLPLTPQHAARLLVEARRRAKGAL